MPVLTAIKDRFSREQPLAGKRIAACLHVTTETAVLMQTFYRGRDTWSIWPLPRDIRPVSWT